MIIKHRHQVIATLVLVSLFAVGLFGITPPIASAQSSISFTGDLTTLICYSTYIHFPGLITSWVVDAGETIVVDEYINGANYNPDQVIGVGPTAGTFPSGAVSATFPSMPYPYTWRGVFSVVTGSAKTPLYILEANCTGLLTGTLSHTLVADAVIADGRINAYDVAAPTAAYCIGDGLVVYAIDDAGEGIRAFFVTDTEVQMSLDEAIASGQHVLLGDQYEVQLWALADTSIDGAKQLQLMGPNEYMFIFPANTCGLTG